MPIEMRGNYIFVQPGEKAFKVASNYTNYLELGLSGSTDYYLEARIESGEFLVDATLWDSAAQQSLIIENNFPTVPAANRQVLTNGYRIMDAAGGLVLGLEVDDNICLLKGRITTSDGELVAEDVSDDFLVHRGPMVLGRAGQSRGIVIG